MLFKTLKICFFLCIIASAKAQNFVDATIFKTNGDSISGQINYQEWYINPEFITFKAKNSSKIQEFRPKDLSKFVVKSKNEIYESAIINVLDQTERDLEAIDASPSIKDALQSLKFRSDTAFLLVLEKGKGSLYSYVDNRSLEHYFIRKDKGWYIELMNPKMKITESKIGMEVSRISYLHIEDYKTRLKELTSDCPKLEKEIDNLGFFQGNFSSIINRYNDCVGKNDYSKENAKPKLKYYATTGLSLPMAFVNSLYYGEYERINGKLTVPIGIGIELKGGRGSNPISFGGELGFAKNVYNHQISRDNGRAIIYNSTLIGLHGVPYIKASFFNKKRINYSTFFKAGLVFSYYSKATFTVDYIPVFTNNTDVYKLKKTSFSFFFSGGYQIKNWFLEGRFEPYSLSLIDYGDDVFKTLRAFLLVGYVF
jgi:hypothetical protein